ncbi:hypothetical protein AC578_6730 [Pseudocercospora eumusae]|uniref:Uncharacterized protein n=1 Tax=Pseudocercospora eumusae TaxID=321146 RepID=A0A139HA39_9PEZI|nr:hypothetical protein AC578_6730 [Pseudocercospora eumusae]
MNPLNLILLLLTPITSAQFFNFGNIFNQNPHQHHHQQEPQNVASDSEWYRQNYEAGGFKEGEALRKIELARKGVL